MAENENGGKAPLETQLRENFSTEWNRADTPDKKKSLMRRLVEMLRDMVANARTAVSEAEKENSGAVPDRAKSAKEEAARPVIQFLQFLTGNNGQPLDNETLQSLGLDEKQISFLQTLGNTRHSADSATFLNQVINRAIDDTEYLKVSKEGEQKTQLEKDYDLVKLNQVAAESFQESMKKLAREGKLQDTEGNNLTEEDVEDRFSVVERQQHQRQQATQNQSAQQGGQEQINPVTGRPYRSGKRGAEATPNQMAYGQYVEQLRRSIDPVYQEIHDALESNRETYAAIEEDQSMSRDAKEQRLNELQQQQNELNSRLDSFNSRREAALEYLSSGEVQEPFLDADEVRQYLKDNLGIDESGLNTAMEIVNSAINEGPLDGTYEGYSDLAKEVNRKYTTERIRSEIIKDGRLDLEGVRRLQGDIEDTIGVLFETLYNSPKADFNDAFSPYSEGQMLRKVVQHLRVRINEISQEMDTQEGRKRVRDILNDMIISQIQRRPALERIVHQYQQVGATIDLEKLRDILKTYNITTLQEFYNDDLTKIISDLMPQFVQKLFIQNGNNMVNDLFQLIQVDKKVEDEFVVGERDKRYKRFVVKYREECIDYMHNVINEIHPEWNVSKERINARFSRAYLDNFLLSLRGIKVMSKALPMHHKFADLPFVNLITGVFNPLQGWGKFGLRGRGHQEAGDAETTEYQGMDNFMFNEVAGHEYIKKYGDVFDDFHPAQTKREGDKRILYEVYPGNDQLMQDLRTGRWDVYYSMLEVYKGMVFGNIIDQAGWTFDGFNETTINNLSQQFMGGRKYGELSREEQLELKYKTSGVITAFWDVGGYASEDVMNRFVRYLYNQELDFEGAIARKSSEEGRSLTDEEKEAVKKGEIDRVRSTKLSDMDWNKKTGEYTKGDKRFEKIFDVKLGDKQTKVAFREYRMYRETALMGQVFHQLLLKDPNAWLGELVQAYPQLLQGYVTYTDNSGKTQTVRGSDFYFNLQNIPDSAISKDDKVKRDRFRYEILPKFRGKEEDDYLTNVPHLQKIMNFYADLVQRHMETDEVLSEEYNNLTNEDKLKALAETDNLNKAIDRLNLQLSIAHQKAVDRHESAIKEEYIEDEMVKNAMFGDSGLIPYFNNMVNSRSNYFGDGDTDLGEENSFYQRWAFSREQRNDRSLPEGDTNMKYLFEDVRNAQALDRRLSTDMAFAKAQEVLNKVPSTCKKAADADTFEAWYGTIEELHSEMSVIADEDQGQEQKYQQLLYQTICNWFSVDSDAERMFTGFLHQMKLGTDVSMATLKSDNMTKFLLDQDNRRQYLKNLRDKSYLKGNYDMIGGWGFDTAEMVAGVNLGEIMRRQAIYALMGAIVITIGTAIKEGYEEEVEED